MAKNSWFKHYNNASDGSTLDMLFAENDFESIAIYWWILEQVSKFEDYEIRGKVTLNPSQFKRKLNWNLPRTVRVCSHIASRFDLLFEYKVSENLIHFTIPKWSELQENRGGKKEAFGRAKPHVLTDQKTTDLRYKIEDKRQKNKLDDFFEILNPTILKNTLLTKSAEIEKIENFLLNPLAFGNFVPAVFHKNSKAKMLATLVHVYESPEIFKNDLNAIIAEKNTLEKVEFAKSDYIATRVKNKALELYNAGL